MNPLLLVLLAAARPAAAQFRAAPVPVPAAGHGRAASVPAALPAAGTGRAVVGAPVSLSAVPVGVTAVLPAAPLPIPALTVTAMTRAAAEASAARPAAPADVTAVVPATPLALHMLTDSPMTRAAAGAAAVHAAAGAAVKTGTLDAFFDGTRAMVKPPIEAWTVGSKTYDSTARLVRELPDSAAPVAASYSFGRFDSVSRGERLGNVAVGAATGFTAGGVAGLLFSVLGGLAGAVLGLFFFGDPSGGLAVGEAELVTAVFAGAGAVMGLFIGWEEGGKPWRGWVGGEIYRHDGKLLFRTFGERGRATVDLAAYAEAPQTGAPTAVTPWPVWKTAAYGLALAGLAALATGFPLVQIVGLWVAGPALGAWLGNALSAHGEVKGGLLGGALGALLPVSMFLALAAGAPTGDHLLYLTLWALAVTATGGAFGAAIGNRVRAGLARRAADFPADQWWSPDRG